MKNYLWNKKIKHSENKLLFLGAKGMWQRLSSRSQYICVLIFNLASIHKNEEYKQDIVMKGPRYLKLTVYNELNIEIKIEQ